MTLWPELRVNVARLRRHDNPADLTRTATRIDEVDVTATVSASAIETSTAKVVDGTPIHVDVKLRSGVHDIEARGSIGSVWEAECRRCLGPVTGAIEIDLAVIFSGSAETGDTDEADVYEIDGEYVDVGEAVREELMLALPLSPICGEDCAGADPDRFPTAEPPDVASTDAGGETRDPRWDALSVLRFDED